jgi:hypothetical protein
VLERLFLGMRPSPRMPWKGVLQKPMLKHEKFYVQRRRLSDRGIPSTDIILSGSASDSSKARSVTLGFLERGFSICFLGSGAVRVEAHGCQNAERVKALDVE